MGQAKVRKKLLQKAQQEGKVVFSKINDPNSFTPADTEATRNEELDQYLKQRLSQYGHFARTGWQAWMFLALHKPELFPVKLPQFLDTCVSPVLFPMNYSSLDGMLHSYFRIHEVRMFESTLAALGETPPEQSYEQIREKRWESLMKQMSSQLHRVLVNKIGAVLQENRISSTPISST